MGFIEHEAIILSSWSDGSVARACQIATGAGLTVIGPSPAMINGYTFATVCPDGSKEGWDESDIGDARRREFLEKLGNEMKFDDGSWRVDWVIVTFGDGPARVKGESW